METKVSILNGSFLSDAYQESLKPSSFIRDVQAIADRSKLSFDDITSLSQQGCQSNSEKLGNSCVYF